MKKRKIASFVLSVVTAVSMLPSISAFADAEPDYIWHMEFDGNDDMTGVTWYHDGNSSQGITEEYMTIEPVDGTVEFNKENCDSRMPYLKFMEKSEDGSYTRNAMNIQNYSDLVFETRLKMEGNIAGLGKQICGMIQDGNYYATIFQQNSMAVYGGGIRNEASAAEIISDFELKSGEWYTYIIHLQNNKTMTVEIVSDSGDVYFGPSSGISYNGTLKEIESFPFAMTDSVVTTVDYIRLYDNTLLTSPSATYQNNGTATALDGAIGIPDSLTATITFNDPITENDLCRIVVNNNAEVSKTLSEDGKIITLDFTGLTPDTQYTINTGTIGQNKASSISFNTLAVQDPRWIYEAEFDGNDYDLSNWVNVTSINAEESTLFAQSGGNSYLSVTIDGLSETAAKNISYETRIKYSPGTNDNFITSGDKKALYSSKNFLDIGNFRLFTDKSGNLGYINSSNTNTDALIEATSYNFISDYKIYAETWYTIRVDYSTETKKLKLTVTDENGNTFKSNDDRDFNDILSDKIGFGYLYQIKVTMDYFRICNEDLVPKPAAAYNGIDLNTAKNVIEGTEAIVTLPYPVTEEDLSKITLNGEGVPAEIIDEYNVKVPLFYIGYRQWNTLFVDQINGAKSAEFVFRSADEPKYLYRAEFDGNDDDTPIMTNSNTQITNNSEYISDGILSMPYNNRMHFKFSSTSGALNCEGLENVVLETRIKYGSDGVIGDGSTPIQTDFAVIRVLNGVFRYDCIGSNSTTGKDFMVYDTPFEVLRDEWYTFKFNVNYNTHTYSVTVSDEHGNVANSGTLKFLNNSTSNNINNVSYTWRSGDAVTASVYLDYLRISDEDYGRAKISYSNGADLDNAALIPITGEQFTITCKEGVYANTAGITLKDEYGNNIEFDAYAIDNVITLTPDILSYNTKYTLFVPKSATDALTDQTVNFRTEWNKNAEFVYPTGFEADDFNPDNKLDVVFFGGSITNQDGWRVVTTNWFKEKYGEENVNAVNASVGGTGAAYGWTRINRDVISKNPDIVFVEFATNDANNVNAGTDIESIVRTLNTMEKPPVIIFVYTTVINFADNNNSISEQEKVAQHYGIPSINIRDYMLSLYNNDSEFASDWDNKVYLTDGTHPSAEASTMYGEYVNALLESESVKYFVYPQKSSVLNDGAKDYCYDYENVSHTLSGIGDTYSFDIIGDEFAMEFSKSSSAGMIKVDIDGITIDEAVNTYRTSGPDTQLRYDGLGYGKHTVTITVIEPGDVTVGGNDAVLHTIYRMKNSGILFNNPEFDAISVTAGELLTASVDYIATEEKSFTLVVALYNSEDKITSIQAVTTTADASGEERTLPISVTPADGDTKAKAFVWDGLNTMIPLTESTGIGY